MAYLALIVEDVVINKWEINQDELVIGRVKFCDIQIDDKSVSSKHARLVTEGDNLLQGTQVTYLEDLFSTNGTEVNGKAITRVKLASGDTIKIGFNLFRFVSGSALGLDETTVIVG